MRDECSDQHRFNAPARKKVNDDRNQIAFDPLWGQGDRPMMIFMLAAAMTIAMLIATVFGLREEAERVRVETRRRQANRYGPY
jgi:cytochrome P450